MRKLWAFALVGLIAGSSLAFGQTTYRWVDEKGSVHFTDDLTRVPERYRNQIRTDNVPTETVPVAPKGQAPAPTPPPSVTQPQPVPAKRDALGRGEDYWQGQVKAWKDKLDQAQKSYESASTAVKEKQQELEQAKFKPKSYQRKLEGELKGLQDKATDWSKQVEEAKYMLGQGLQKRAEDDLADPNWVKTK